MISPADTSNELIKLKDNDLILEQRRLKLEEVKY